jgi:transposase
VNSLRSWVKQAEIDTGARSGTTSADASENKRLRQENRELKRANKILQRAAHFFRAELDRQQR